MRIGVISDTHNLLRPEALAALEGVDEILHCGDVCKDSVLDKLDTIAPVIAIAGNCDPPDLFLPATVTIERDGVVIYMVHNFLNVELDPRAGTGVVLYGDSHKPSLSVKKGILYLNPGSAGPRRPNLPVTVAILEIENGKATAKIVDII